MVGKRRASSTIPENRSLCKRAKSVEKHRAPSHARAAPATQSVRSVDVILESENSADPIKINETKLRKESGYFEEILSRFEDADVEFKPLIIKDVSSTTFSFFKTWLDGDNIDLFTMDSLIPWETLQEDKRTDEIKPIWLALIDAYKFARSFQTPQFETVVMIMLQRLLALDHWDKLLPPVDVIHYAYDAVGLQSRLFKYLVACFARSGRVYSDDMEELDQFQELPPKFLAAVLVQIYKDRRDRWDADVYKGMWAWMPEVWCDYHEHKTAAARKDCEYRNHKKVVGRRKPHLLNGDCTCYLPASQLV